jgi:hypothetical protein
MEMCPPGVWEADGHDTWAPWSGTYNADVAMADVGGKWALYVGAVEGHV